MEAADVLTMVLGAGYPGGISMDISMSIMGWNIWTATITETTIMHRIIKNRIHLTYLTYFISLLTSMRELDMSTPMFRIFCLIITHENMTKTGGRISLALPHGTDLYRYLLFNLQMVDQ